MNFPFFVAKRYFFSKQSKSIINIITWTSVLGLAVSTAAMVIVLSAFNGIEKMVSNLYTDFDPSLTIESTQSKTFNQTFVAIDKIKALPDVANYTRVIEETALIRHENKWVNATLYGVDTTFLSMSNMKKHLLQGALPKKFEENSGMIGAEILNRLDGVIFTANPEQVTIYAASRDAKISMQANPFNTKRIALSGSINFNREVNREAIIIPLETATDLLDYKDDITRYGIQLKPGADLEGVKAAIQHIVGKQFKVKTNFEKNALIFKTSKIEKIIVFCILIFIFILAAFNMVASLTMLFIEKKKNLKTMMAFGLYQQSIFSIFFLQGCMICFFGVFFGIFLGYGVVAIQYFGEVLTIPDSGGEIFPVGVKLMDIGLILLVTLVSGVVSAWIPVRILVNRFLKAND